MVGRVRLPSTRRGERPLKITFLGHAGLFAETAHGSVLCDPWFTPAYFGSWFPFPSNEGLDRETFTASTWVNAIGVTVGAGGGTRTHMLYGPRF
jgi:L-ascorbate metabolism protein UlaG (beta-lactamase superfamily)